MFGWQSTWICVLYWPYSIRAYRIEAKFCLYAEIRFKKSNLIMKWRSTWSTNEMNIFLCEVYILKKNKNLHEGKTTNGCFEFRNVELYKVLDFEQIFQVQSERVVVEGFLFFLNSFFHSFLNWIFINHSKIKRL